MSKQKYISFRVSDDIKALIKKRTLQLSRQLGFDLSVSQYVMRLIKDDLTKEKGK